MIALSDYDVQIAVFANSLYHTRDANGGYALVFKQPDGAQIVLAWPLHNTGEDALQGIAVAQAIEVAGKVVRAWADKYVGNLGGRMLNFVPRARVLVFSDNKTMLDVLDWRAASVSAVHYKVIDTIMDQSYKLTHMQEIDVDLQLRWLPSNFGDEHYHVESHHLANTWADQARIQNRTFAIFDGEHGILAMQKGVYENLGEEIKALEAMFPKPSKPPKPGRRDGTWAQPRRVAPKLQKSHFQQARTRAMTAAAAMREQGAAADDESAPTVPRVIFVNNAETTFAVPFAPDGTPAPDIIEIEFSDAPGDDA